MDPLNGYRVGDKSRGADGPRSAQLRPLLRQTSFLCYYGVPDSTTESRTTVYKSDNRRLTYPLPLHRFPLSFGVTGYDLRGHNLQFGGASRLRELSLFIMVYDWDGKREICYQMYIKDKKALEEIMDYMKTAYQFAPR